MSEVPLYQHVRSTWWPCWFRSVSPDTPVCTAFYYFFETTQARIALESYGRFTCIPRSLEIPCGRCMSLLASSPCTLMHIDCFLQNNLPYVLR